MFGEASFLGIPAVNKFETSTFSTIATESNFAVVIKNVQILLNNVSSFMSYHNKGLQPASCEAKSSCSRTDLYNQSLEFWLICCKTANNFNNVLFQKSHACL